LTAFFASNFIFFRLCFVTNVKIVLNTTTLWIKVKKNYKL